MKLSPAEYVINIFGGIRPLARAINKSPATVCAWRTNNDRKENTGSIPSHCHKPILDQAKKLKLDLTAEDLIFGRTITTKKGHNNVKKERNKRAGGRRS